jgi:hypothetical protein
VEKAPARRRAAPRQRYLDVRLQAGVSALEHFARLLYEAIGVGGGRIEVSELGADIDDGLPRAGVGVVAQPILEIGDALGNLALLVAGRGVAIVGICYNDLAE